jgi:serine/threonine protein kinase
MTGDVPAQPGERIAGYVLEAQIGAGGMAVVFRARDERLGRPVALKLLAAGLAADGAFRQRFIRESRAAAAVDHPNIIPVYEAGEADGVLFIAMRYVQGGDVRALIDRSGPLPAARAWAIISQVAGALDSAHRHGLIHRDVKPGNILLDAAAAGQNRGPGRGGQPEHVYLSDFGISKQPAGASSLTLAGQFVGTLDYIAPEQIDGRDLDGRADLYSLGCAAYELLSGKPPFRQSQGLALVRAHLSDPPPMLTAERRDLPVVIDRVLASAMAKSPDDRYPTCVQFAADLGRSLGLVAGNPVPPEAHGQSRSGPATEGAWPAPSVTPTAGGPPGSHGHPQPVPYRGTQQGPPSGGDPYRAGGTAWPPHAPQAPQAPQAPRRRSSAARTGGIAAVAAVLAAAVVAAVVLVGRGHGPSPADAGGQVAGSAGTSAAPARSTPSPPAPASASAPASALAPASAPPPAPASDSGSASGSAAGSQAAGVNALLSSGAGTNPRLLSALGAINQCTAMASSVTALTQIRNQRNSEYGQAQVITVSALAQGSTLKTDLSQALYYSLQADDQYLSWADQQSRGPCHDGSEPTPASDDQASAYKNSFTQLWNPIALQYGLTTQSVTSM